MLNLHSDSRVVRGYKDFHKNMWYKYVISLSLSLFLSPFAKKIKTHSPHINSQTEQIISYVYIYIYLWLFMYVIVYIIVYAMCESLKSLKFRV